ncbi:TadE family type IV pilus minor pilin [Aeromicrobium sp. 179-A 4D2 NHS]|uniref:TadE family type IV pilus minor pilin n=1 Tax=Aeromicrobium sp. 179-A 4D2 NHS TaxID=3142375 RepID=UPI0039A120FB
MRRRDRGMVTAETATVLPFVVLTALVLTWVVSLGLTQMRLADAAREAARVVARGESVADGRDAAIRLVPGARVRIETHGGTAEVQVRHRARLPLVPRVRIDLAARAVTVME